MVSGFLIDFSKEGPDDNIYSFGFGAVLDDNIQMDLAVSIGGLVEEFIFSTVYRF